MTATQADTLEEAHRLIDAARRDELQVRLLGGVAILLLSGGRLPSALARSYADIDLAVPAGEGQRAGELLSRLGYAPAQRFNAVNSDRRLIFDSGTQGNHLDVFVGGFRMCHEVSLDRAFAHPGSTIPLAELLLTKLQVVKINHKDLQDIWALVGEHELGDSPGETIEPSRIAEALASDWGLWRTAQQTIDVARRELARSGLEAFRRAQIEQRLTSIWNHVEQCPKSLRWKTRAKIGDRLRWYEEPDEVDPDGVPA
jgi:hypothetical protein